jgi:DNA polymerase-3 subunit delta'
MNELLLNPKTRAQVELFLAKPAHAVLISGSAGSGKYSLALEIAANLLEFKRELILENPYFLEIKRLDNKSEISIDAVRGLVSKLSLKVPTDGSKAINRVVLIAEANRLTREAQNALLKILEEPPAKTSVILTADSETDLLPTILSRLQKIALAPPTLEQALDYFNDYPEKDIQSSYLLSRGGAGLQTALLSEQANHPLKQSVDKAKLFLGSNQTEKLIFLQKLAKNKDEFMGFLDGLSRTVAALHESAIKKGANSSELLKFRKSLQASIKALEDNANPRLVAMALGVSLG